MKKEQVVSESKRKKFSGELLEQASNLFDAKRGPKPADPSASPERLYSEIGRLKMELDWLKKKSGICQ